MNTTAMPRPAFPVQPTLRGDLAVWVFILAELLAFGVFFLAYAVARSHDPAGFAAAQAHLDRGAGILNTLLLITSSAAVAHAVATVRRAGHPGIAARSLIVAIACGLGYVVVKLGEYSTHFAAGMSLSSGTFAMFYLGLTAFHFMHVLLGLTVLTILWRRTAAGAYGPHDAHGLESGAAYWHMLDLVWLLLFPLVYVLH